MRCGTSSSTFTDCPTRYDPPSNVEKYAPRAATFWVTVRPNTDARVPFSLSTRIGYLSVSRGLVLCSDLRAIASSQCLCAEEPRALGNATRVPFARRPCRAHSASLRRARRDSAHASRPSAATRARRTVFANRHATGEAADSKRTSRTSPQRRGDAEEAGVEQVKALGRELRTFAVLRVSASQR